MKLQEKWAAWHSRDTDMTLRLELTSEDVQNFIELWNKCREKGRGRPAAFVQKTLKDGRRVSVQLIGEIQ